MKLISGSAHVAGVIGWPVAHSRSPRIHGTWLERHGIDGAYVPLAIQPQDFIPAVQGLAKAGFRGVNVTIPHKEAAFALCDEVEAFARRVGAVNMLTFENGRIIGRNYDGYGYIANLRAHGVRPGAGAALILGAGGAARAIAAALQDEGAEVTLTNRTRERAEELARLVPGARVLDWERRAEALGDYALLVNTTALGMSGEAPLEMDLDGAAPVLAVSDIVYAPLETALLADARARGLTPVEGLGMLLHQAVPAFERWFGVRPEVDDELYRIVAA
jgi:shikimate dehydrogenase